MDMSPNSDTRLRPAVAIDPLTPIDQVMALLAEGLAGRGSALNFTNHTIESVPADVSVIVQTTGSSGTPKYVGLNRSALIISAQLSLEYLHAAPGDLWSLLLPLHHIAGINVLVRSLELVTTPIDLRESKSYTDVDFTAVVPTQIFSALNGDQNLLAHLQSAKKVLVGGAALTDELHQSAVSAEISIARTYGMSETSGGCVYEGRTLGQTQVRISENGFIEIAGPIIASGYIQDPATWSESFYEGWFITSDLGQIDSYGSLSIMGRGDDLYISGGEKVSLAAVTKKLEERYSQNNWSVLALDDLKWGQRLVIAVAGENPPTQEEIATLLGDTFGNAAKPKQYLTFETLPLIGIGKVDRVAVRKRAEEEFNG